MPAGGWREGGSGRNSRQPLRAQRAARRATARLPPTPGGRSASQRSRPVTRVRRGAAPAARSPALAGRGLVLLRSTRTCGGNAKREARPMAGVVGLRATGPDAEQGGGSEEARRAKHPRFCPRLPLSGRSGVDERVLSSSQMPARVQCPKQAYHAAQESVLKLMGKACWSNSTPTSTPLQHGYQDALE